MSQTGSPERGRTPPGVAVVRTFLIADMRGYTAFTREHGDEAAAALATRFASIMREGVEAHGGEVIELRGDEAVAVFASARAALRAAVELQLVLGDESRLHPNLMLGVGMGLDAGEAVALEGGYRGGALNLAARLCSVAGPGEVLASKGVVHLARAIDGLVFVDHEDVVAKGIVDPVGVVGVAASDRTMGDAGGVEGIASPAVATDRPSALDSVTPAIGRAHELRRLSWWWRLARRGRGRSVFVVGQVGMGKTRLLAEVAAAAAADGAPITYRRFPTSGLDRPLIEDMGEGCVLLDDLDSASDEEVEAAVRLADGARERPMLVACAVNEERAAAALRAAIHRLAGEDGVVRLPPLGRDDIQAIAQLYLGETAPHVPTDVGGDTPREIHRRVSEWAEAEVSRRLAGLASGVASDREELRTGEAGLASTVIDVQTVRERARLFAGGVGRIEVATPYKGLVGFGVGDATIFFGRERLVAEMVARVTGASLMAVVGPSGSGKSSAVRAGLVAALRSAILPGIATTIVLRPGVHPLRSLDRALSRSLARSARPGLDEEVDPLEAVREATNEHGAVVVVVDQFEEAFTLCTDEAERAAFVEALVSAADDPRGGAIIVLAVRADFVGRCAEHSRLAALVGANQILVGPMNADECRRAIEQPALREGVRFEAAAVDQLVAEVLGEPGALPLLSTALLELWERRQSMSIGVAELEATGGVHGAVARLADEAYLSLTSAQQSVAHDVFLRLAWPGEGRAVVRRRVPLSEFDLGDRPETARVLEVLTNRRLVTIDDDAAEVAHEALLREWPRLQAWLEEDRHGRELHVDLAAAARHWVDASRDRGELYRGARLSAAVDWSVEHESQLNDAERQFLAASRAVHQREVRRLRVLLGGALAFLLIAVVAAVIALIQQGNANHAATVAEARQLAAQAVVEPRLDRSLLLGREAVDLEDSVATRSSLLAALVRSPAAVHVLHVPAPFGGGPLALSPDGAKLVVGVRNHVVSYDTGTWRRVADVVPPGLGKPDDGINALAFTPDGSRLAVGGGSGTIALLNGHSFRPVGEAMHLYSARWIVRLVFSPDEHTLAVGFARKATDTLCDGAYVVTRFNLSTGHHLSPTVNVSGRHPCVDSIDKLIYTPTGNQLIASDWAGSKRGKVVVLRSSDLRVVRTYSMPGVTGVAISPNGRTLAITTDSGTVGFMAFPDGRLRLASARHASGVWSVEFAPDGRSLVTVSADHDAIVWDVATAAEREVLAGHTDIAVSEAISPDGQTLYTGSGDGTVITWDLSGRHRLGETLPFAPAYPADIFSDAQATAVAISPDGSRLALSPSKGVVRLWDLHTLRPAGPNLHGFKELDALSNGGAEDLAFSPDGDLLAAGGGSSSPVVVWDLRTTRVVARFTPPHPRRCRVNENLPFCTHGNGLAFSPDGRTLANGDGNNGALLWNLKTRESTRLPVGRGRWVLSLAYSPDGTRLVTIDGVGNGALWDVASGRRLLTFPADNAQGWATSVAFSPRGGLFVTGSQGTITLRSTRTGHQVGSQLPIANGYNGVVAFSPDGATIAIAAGDGVELWSTTTRTQIGLALPGAPPQGKSPGGPGNLRFTPDGTRLVIVSPNGLATIWNVTARAWAVHACEIAGRNLTQAEWRRYLPNRPYAAVCPAQ